MLICNLSVLLAERSLKITQASKETGISRTTLTSLAQNKAQGIQLDTLNALCLYLGVTPLDLFPVVNLDIDVINAWADLRDDNPHNPDFQFFDGGFSIHMREGRLSFEIPFTFTGECITEQEETRGEFIYTYSIVPRLVEPGTPECNILASRYASLPVGFKAEIERRIEKAIYENRPLGDKIVLGKGELGKALEEVFAEDVFGRGDGSVAVRDGKRVFIPDKPDDK